MMSIRNRVKQALPALSNLRGQPRLYDAGEWTKLPEAQSSQLFKSSSVCTEHELCNERPFSSATAEFGFCLSIGIMEILAEYLISGFSVLLPNLMKQYPDASSSLWPASILSLTLCSTILVFARLSDMYGGYLIFTTATLWLFLWTLIAGFSTSSLILLCVCRAMQGVAIAAYTPSTFALLGTFYPTGPRRNLALGICGACAPVGFFLGICVSAALPENKWQWYFWIASIMALFALLTAYLSAPSIYVGRVPQNLSMDWLGGIAITSGILLVVYALGAASESSTSWASLKVLLPFLLGFVCLLAALYIEARLASSPIIPLDFFTPKSVKPFVLACLFFYGCFGTWLFTSTAYLQEEYNARGLKLAAWYTPLAVGGMFIAATSGLILHRINPTLLLLLSGCAWVGAPTLLALGNPSYGYWAFPFPSMICGTLGIDLTYTIGVVFLSSVQPAKYQGLAGAVNSILVNMGIAFSLAFAQIVEDKITRPGSSAGGEDSKLTRRSAFWFAAASASFGVALVGSLVRISRVSLDEATDHHSPPVEEISLS